MSQGQAIRVSSYCRSRLLAVWIVAVVGCAGTPQTVVMQPTEVASSSAAEEINKMLTAAALQTSLSSADYRLGPEDLLQITLFNIPETEAGVTPRRTEVRVSQDGKISLPLLGEVDVAGLTASDLEELLKERYNPYLHNPQVGVYIVEYRSQQVAVMGAVRNPGVFQLTGPKTLIDLLSTAGGVTERAGGQVYLHRKSPEGRQTQVIDLTVLARNPALVNIPVQAGDVINVQEAGMFFVDGAVGKPGSYPLSRPYTLTQALAVAGGVTRTLASYGDIAIYRQRNGAEAEKIPVDLSAIWEGKARDPVLEANDVVVVPISTVKYVVERFLGRIGFGSVPGMMQ